MLPPVEEESYTVQEAALVLRITESRLGLVRQGRAEEHAEDDEPEYADHYPDNERG